MTTTVVLEPAVARLVAGDTLGTPRSAPAELPAVDERWTTVAGGPTGRVRVRVVRPAGVTGPLPVVLYIHGGGWLVGNAQTHDHLVRRLAVGAHAEVVFPEYDFSRSARYPTAIEQNYAVAQWIAGRGLRLAVAGDSVGGTMAAALTLMAKTRGDVRFAAQVLFYPMTDATFDTPSYRQFATGYVLSREAARCLWDQYAADPAERAQVTACPLRATTEQLAGLPPALVVTAEADVVRDEAEAYADKLRAAGVPVDAVRYPGVVHDFLMLDSLRGTEAAGAAVDRAVTALRAAFTRPAL